MQDWDNPGETSALLTYEVILTLSYRFRTNTVDHASLPTPGHRKEHDRVHSGLRISTSLRGLQTDRHKPTLKLVSSCSSIPGWF
jgi:hypothetical protein